MFSLGVCDRCRVTFRVGDLPVKNFRMIERHFFGDRLLKSFDFDFGFCIPNSVNSCEQIYEFPPLTDKESKSSFHCSYSHTLQCKKWLSRGTRRVRTASTSWMASSSYTTTAITTMTTRAFPICTCTPVYGSLLNKF